MRILVIQRPTVDCIDGMRLDRFMPGHQYEVGASVGARLLAERWAEPLTGAPPAFAETLNHDDDDDDLPTVDGPAALGGDRRRRSRSKTPST